jgi:hypothetical protein
LIAEESGSCLNRRPSASATPPCWHPGHDPAAGDIARTVGDQVEVLMDGGVCRGGDV